MRKVFISSVIRNFSPLREAARKAVHLMGGAPIMSEEFGARPYSSERACLTEIDQSDVYVLILGADFGFEPTPGTSVTQQEFRHARKAHKPILVFVQEVAMDEMQTRFLAEVENFHSGFYRARFTSAEELKDEIVQGLRQLAQSSNAIPEGTFVERATSAIASIERRDRDSATFWVSFLPQPKTVIELTSIEDRFDEIFQSMCSVGLTKMRAGYEPVELRDCAGITCGKSAVYFFEDGLKILVAAPTLDVPRSRTAFSDWYVAPSRLLNIATSAFHFFDANGGWCQLRLSGMSNAVVREQPSSPTNTFSMPSRNATDYALQGLLIPCTDEAYKSWVNSAVKRIERVFRAS